MRKENKELVTANKEIATRINSYDQKQKEKLITLGQSDKSYRHILSYLESEIAQSIQMANFRYELLCFKSDGVYQLHRAIEEIYGAAQANIETGPSGGTQNMETVDIQLADGTRMKVPYGRISLPDAGEDASINIRYEYDLNLLLISGSCEFRFSSLIDEIVERTKQFLKTGSIYRRQAIELSSDFVPKILDLSSIENEFMVLSERTEYELQPLRSRILFPKRCIEKGIPLKYGCLMEGPYGTGKTLLAFKLAKDAIDNDWGFIYLKSPELLARALRIAKTLDHNGNGVIIFVEDIDQVTRGNRDEALQDILNTLDGGDAKNMNVISLFTTNHVELIEPTFLRGKRIGSIISLGFLDKQTARKFIEFTFKKDGYIPEEEGLDEVCQYIAESKIAPAFMAEITESVKSHMIFTDDVRVKSAFIKNSVESYLHQVDLAQKKDMSETPDMKLASALKATIIGDLTERIGSLEEYVHDNI